jgi:hypothetical protein
MSSEVRIVRPFVGVERFQAILDTWSVHIGPDQIAAGDHAVIGSSNYLGIKPVLVMAQEEAGAEAVRNAARQTAEELGFDPDDVEVLVIASTPFLRLADIAYRKPLSASDAIVPSTVLGGDADTVLRALEAPNGGCDIDVFFILANGTDPKPLAPSRKGTWLGRAQFSIRTELGELGFTPIPLGSEERENLGISAETIRYVEVSQQDLMSEQLSDVVLLYVDEKLLAHLNQSPHSPAARSFQRQLYLDVMSAVVRAAVRNDDFEQLQVSDLDDTFLGRVVDAAADIRKGDTKETVQKRRESALHHLKKQPEKFMAALEAKVTPRDDWKSAIGGVDE